ncbi:MAG: cation:proton antiporter [Thaumarchaeota archaeon]|nr:cation:proton antiporter [Nitrososphaerota archaeon]
MQNYFLQLTSGSGIQSMIEKVTPEIPHSSFITDLAIIMILASIVTLAFFKMRQPLIIGYLFAGMLIGPLSPIWSSLLPEGQDVFGFGQAGILSDLGLLNIFSELGVILLLFVIGIEFPYSKIRSIGKVAIGAGTIGLFLTLGVVFYVANFVGLNFLDSLFLGAALSITSTAVIVKILEDMGRIKKESSILVLGVLIVEDIVAVILIATLESVALVGNVSYDSIILVVIVAGALIGGTLTIGTKVIPKLIDRVAATEHKEILLLSVLGLCFGYALFANVVGLSVAIGAFLAGVLVAESKSAEVSKILSSPIKDMFVAIFFVSVGALMNVAELENYVVLAFGIIALAIAAKFGGALIGMYLFRQEKGKSIRSAFALAGPRGEFSIVIIKTGVDIGAVSSFLFPLIGLISIVSAFISPFLIRASDKVVSKIEE